MINFLKNKIVSYIYYPAKKTLLKRKHNLIFGEGVTINRNTTFEGFNYLSTKSSLVNSHIGYASYIGTDSKLSKTKIGRFTSIGPNVKCIFGNHPSHTFVSTHPAFFSTRMQSGFSFTEKQLFQEFANPIFENEPYSISIGNDVWIGAEVIILDGVTIGDGAIIAAGSLINKDVPPYSIVGGIPGKILKKRFTENQIQFLLEFKWWEKDINWLKANWKLFTNIDLLIESSRKK